MKCFFCGEDNPAALEVHHIVPRSLGVQSDEVIVVCASCHRKLHYIYRVLFRHLNIDAKLDNGAKAEEVEKEYEEAYKKYREQMSLRRAMKIVIEVIRRMTHDRNVVCVKIDEIISELERRGVDGELAGRAIKKARMQGLIYEPFGRDKCFRVA